jgi:hypothetical protein
VTSRLRAERAGSQYLFSGLADRWAGIIIPQESCGNRLTERTGCAKVTGCATGKGQLPGKKIALQEGN